MRSLITFAIALIPAAAASAADLRFSDDASLRAVQFIDAREGWAAGDEGVIWHTIDGGRTWERQATGTRASLRSLCFLDAYTGWAVGREEFPGGTSVGVVLFTRDGGVAWKRLLAGALPAVNQVRFINARTGFLLTDASEQFPAGIVKTNDGGKTWDPVKGPRATGWRAGDFHDADTGILVGPWNSLMTLRPNVFGKAQLDDLAHLGTRHFHAVQVLPKRVVAVGDGGLMLTSVSGGAGWAPADLKLPPEIAASLDFHAIYGTGQRAWVVGRPGSCILTSADAGATWKLQRTGHTAPLHGVFFLNEQRGWAVGDLGAILTTSDGGLTWNVQRQGGKRAAVLMVHARLEDVPVDAVALLGADEGYLAAVLQVTTPDPATAPLRRAAERARSGVALRQAGAAAAESLWQFPLPHYLAQAGGEDVLKHWHKGHAGRAERELLRQLVLALRLWRPEVVITDPASAPASARRVPRPVGALIAEALQEAVRQAEDPASFPEHLEVLGLSAWKVRKLYALTDQTDAAVVHDNTLPRPRLHGTLREFAAAPLRLLHDQEHPAPPRRAFRLLSAAAAGAEGQSSLMLGASTPLGDARRSLDAAEEIDPRVAEAMRRRRHLLTLAENLQQQEHTLAQIAPLLAQLADEDAAPTAYAVAQLYARRGQWDLARESFLLIVDRYPAHPLAIEACRWLIRHNASSELRRRYELQQFFVVKNFDFHALAPEGQVIQQVKADADERKPLSLRDDVRAWYRGNVEFNKRLSAFGPLFSSDPEMQFCLQASKRRLGDLTGPPQWYARFKGHVGKGPWHDAAAAELWLTERDGPAPRRLATCRLTDQRPHLDATFDDACWKGLKPLPLEDAAGATAGQFPTEAMFAYDQEFLYLALRCRHPAGHSAPTVKVRPRDPDLDAYDRVSVMFDLDRDYSSYFHMQVDQRGCVREDCCGDPSWNPKWFVKCSSDETAWHIEAAIPLSELSGERLPLGTAWACNIVRIIPGRGVQAYSLPADVEPRPEGMGLLLFQQDPARGGIAPMPKAP
jgi:photosystem II stability/assembly factor-like uncharacterized protein